MTKALFCFLNFINKRHLFKQVLISKIQRLCMYTITCYAWDYSKVECGLATSKDHGRWREQRQNIWKMGEERNVMFGMVGVTELPEKQLAYI